jgi:hypothetical protein
MKSATPGRSVGRSLPPLRIRACGGGTRRGDDRATAAPGRFHCWRQALESSCQPTAEPPGTRKAAESRWLTTTLQWTPADPGPKFMPTPGPQHLTKHTGSYGAGLARLLAERGEWVVEVDRPRRPARRGGKTDALDAMRAASEALAQERPAVPRRRGDRQALRVLLATRQGAVIARTCAINQLKALIVSAPEELRAELRARSTSGQVEYCAALRDRPARSLEHRTTARALPRLPSGSGSWPLRRLSSRASLAGWWPRSRRGCWNCPGSGRSAPARCW